MSEYEDVGTITIKYGKSSIQFQGTDTDKLFLCKLLHKAERQMFLAGFVTGSIAVNSVWLLTKI